MAAKNNIPRYVIVEDQEIGAESVVRVVETTNSTNEQAGLTLNQPDVSNTLVGDIRPSLSGVPERESSGSMHSTSGGGSDTLRWGFLHTGADGSDLQFRQRPSVSGREPALISTSTTDWFSTPKLVPLVDGDLLCVWMKQTKLFAAQDITVSGWSTNFYRAVLDHENDSWSSEVAATDLGLWGSLRLVDAAPSWKGFDVVQFPDTGELIAVVVGDAEYSGVPEGIGAVYASNDLGLTWVLRARLSFLGINGLLGPLGIVGRSKSVAVEITQEGRIVVMWGTRIERMVTMTSDDRGKTWTAIEHDAVFGDYESNDAVPVRGYVHNAVTMHKMRNGVILGVQAVSAKRIAGSEFADIFLWKTADGISWESAVYDDFNFTSLVDVAICESPDGYPWIFGAIHGGWYGSGTPSGLSVFDELVHIPFAFRDVSAGDTPADVWQADRPRHWHLLVDEGKAGVARPNAPSGDLASLTDNPPVLDGFVGIASTQWRGQIVHAAVMSNQNNTRSSLMVYRSNFFQPIQEREGTGVQDDGLGNASETRFITGFSRTWDCYQDPASWGFGLTTTGGSGAIVAGGAEDGYWRCATSANTHYWDDPTLPNASEAHTSVVRAVMRPVSGGVIGFDGMGFRLRLHDSSLGTSFSVSVQLNVVGSDIEIQAYDNRLGALVGVKQTLAGALGQYLEILLSTQRFDPTASTVNCLLYVRAHDKNADPDWLVGYTNVYVGTLQCDAIALDDWMFGHRVSGTAVSHWKSFNIWRQEGDPSVLPAEGTTFSYPPLNREVALGYSDSDAFNLRTDGAEANILNDSGWLNFMRTAQGISHPAQFFADGIHAEWRGESLSTGAVDYSTGFVFAGKHLLDQSSPQREYRSDNTAREIEIVLDATLKGGTNAIFTTSAIAVIGRNFPAMKLQFSDVDTPAGWAAPAIDLRAAVPGLGAFDRATHILDFSGGMATGSYRVRVTTPAALAKNGQVFRPHRFRAVENGRTFYAVFPSQPSSGTTSVIKIIDNTEDVLILESDPVALGITASQMSIISDRFAWDFSHAMPIASKGHRFIRLVLEHCTHEGADEFFRMGSIILGQPTELEPGIVWGYATSRSPGASLVGSLTGAMFSSRQSAERGAWSFDAPALLSANESEANDSDNIEQARASWQKLVDLASRVEQFGEMCALVFDGLRFEGASTESGEQLLTDPYDLALVRLTSIGAATHQGYSLDTIPSVSADATDCVPRPVSAVRGITFTEQL